MARFHVGIDVGRTQHVARVLDTTTANMSRSFQIPVSHEGFERFRRHLEGFSPNQQDFFVAIEETGAYHVPLAGYLWDYWYTLALVNPARTRAFRKAEGHVASLLFIGGFFRLELHLINNLGFYHRFGHMNHSFLVIWHPLQHTGFVILHVIPWGRASLIYMPFSRSAVAGKVYLPSFLSPLSVPLPSFLSPLPASAPVSQHGVGFLPELLGDQFGYVIEDPIIGWLGPQNCLLDLPRKLY